MSSIQCAKCKHRLNREYGCKAFPDGIPWVVLSGEHDHQQPHKDDNGIQFEPVDEGEQD